MAHTDIKGVGPNTSGGSRIGEWGGGGSKVKTKTILATPTTGLAHHVQLTATMGNPQSLHSIFYMQKHNCTSSLKNKTLSYLLLNVLPLIAFIV